MPVRAGRASDRRHEHPSKLRLARLAQARLDALSTLLVRLLRVTGYMLG